MLRYAPKAHESFTCKIPVFYRFRSVTKKLNKAQQITYRIPLSKAASFDGSVKCDGSL